MTQNCLPQIDIRLDKNMKGVESIIHSANKLVKRKSINYQRQDWVKRAALQQNQNGDQFVRISFTNKTTLFKRKRINSLQNGYKGFLAPLQCHQTKKIMILNQSSSTQNNRYLSDLRACKSFLNHKKQNRKSLIDFNGKINIEESKKHRHNLSLIEIDSVRNITPVKQKNSVEQFSICPWNDKQIDSQKQNKYGRQR